jgi:hypothetical protein
VPIHLVENTRLSSQLKKMPVNHFLLSIRDDV